MPSCGTSRCESLNIPGGQRWVEVPVPGRGGVCQCSLESNVGKPLYVHGNFTSYNPNAIISVESHDWNGTTTVTKTRVGDGATTSYCTKNCGAGTGFFGLGGGAADIGRAVAGIASQIALQAGANALAPGVGAAVLSTTSQYAASEGKMGLNLSGLLGTAGQIIGGINTSGFGDVSKYIGGGLQIAGAAFAPQPAAQQVFGPPAPVVRVGTQAPVYPSQSQAMAMTGNMLGPTSVATAAMMAAKEILPKIAAALGRRGITLSKAIELARKLGKFFTSPEAIALYMGITVSELAQLITANSARKRRRMNPANAHALRRAARRIKSFHRLCSHTDLIRTRHRSRGARCGTCRKSPCRC